MKKLFYFIIILIFGACSVTTEETEDNTNYGTNEGTASSPVELTVGTAKNGSVIGVVTVITSSQLHPVREAIN